MVERPVPSSDELDRIFGEFIVDGLARRDVLGAPTQWWGAPIATVTDAG